MLLGVTSFAHVLDVWAAARNELSEILSAFEFFDESCAFKLKQNCGLDVPPFLEGRAFSVLIETSGSHEEHDSEKLMQFLESTKLEDGAIAANGKEFNFFWQLREDIPEAMMRDGALYAYDVSLPRLEQMYELVEASKQFVADNDNRLMKKHGLKEVVGYGHIGDGNLHINISAEKFEKDFSVEYERWLWKKVAEMKGSISAEHGIGAAKTEVIRHSKSREALELMWDVKQMMDPKGILNPYKVICPQASAKWGDGNEGLRKG